VSCDCGTGSKPRCARPSSTVGNRTSCRRGPDRAGGLTTTTCGGHSWKRCRLVPRCGPSSSDSSVGWTASSGPEAGWMGASRELGASLGLGASSAAYGIVAR